MCHQYGEETKLTIKIGDNPQGTSDLNKFMCGVEGLRGKLVAIHKSQRKGIVISCNDSIGAFTAEDKRKLQRDKGIPDEMLKEMLSKTDITVKWGKMYLVVEGNDETYPIALKEVTKIPRDDGWEIVFNQEEEI